MLMTRAQEYWAITVTAGNKLCVRFINKKVRCYFNLFSFCAEYHPLFESRSVFVLISDNEKKNPKSTDLGLNMVRLAGLEPVTPTMSRWCSNQLSYSRLTKVR